MNAEGEITTSSPTNEEKQALRTLVHGIVLAQGNVFIKELLRSKNITIGTKKTEFEANLLRAIKEEKLRLADVEAWLQEVEGWGDQHVYLYHLPSELRRANYWATEKRTYDRLNSEQKKLWQARASLEFPEHRRLTGIYYENRDVLRYIWHQRQVFWVRTPEEDEEKEKDGELYQMRAYRERMDRSVMRFELRLSLGLAAAFLQLPWTKKAHDEALEEIRSTVASLVMLDELPVFKAATAIKKLDKAELKTTRDDGLAVTAQKTRLSDAGAYVEFASTSKDLVYKESEAVRQVRRAVREDRFTGTDGVFFYEEERKGSPKRRVKIQLIGPERRIRLWAQLNATEVWEILKLLGKYG